LAGHFAIHPEQLIPPKTLSENGPEIQEFETMVAAFEATHALEKLHSIVELSPDLATVLEFDRDLSRTPEELELLLKQVAITEPVYVAKQREKIAVARTIVLSAEDKERFELIIAARKDLASIKEKMNNFKGYTGYEGLKEKYMRLSRAVGMRSKNKLDHFR
jgi:hypothetical protein